MITLMTPEEIQQCAEEWEPGGAWEQAVIPFLYADLARRLDRLIELVEKLVEREEEGPS